MGGWRLCCWWSHGHGALPAPDVWWMWGPRCGQWAGGECREHAHSTLGESGGGEEVRWRELQHMQQHGKWPAGSSVLHSDVDRGAMGGQRWSRRAGVGALRAEQGTCLAAGRGQHGMWLQHPAATGWVAQPCPVWVAWIVKGELHLQRIAREPGLQGLRP